MTKDTPKNWIQTWMGAGHRNEQILSLNVLYHTIPHKLCRCEAKDVYGLQSFVSTHTEESDSL